MSLGILCAGEILFDFISRNSGANLGASTVFEKRPGGAPFNCAVAALRGGARVGYLGKVGADSFGDSLWDLMGKEGLDLSLAIRERGTNTTLAFVALDDSGKPDFCFYRDNAADVSLKLEDVKSLVPEEWSIYHFGSISLLEEPSSSTYISLFHRFKNSGVITSFDPNIRPPAISDPVSYRRTVKKIALDADLIKLSDDDLAWIAGSGSPLDMLSRFESNRDGLLYLTLGGSGAIARWAGEIIEIPPFKVDVADTTGCGDAFMGLLLAQLYSDNVKDLSIIDRTKVFNWGRVACAGAAIVATRDGAAESMPFKHEVYDFMSDHILRE